MRTQGTVVSVTDGICRIHGLSDVMQGEMLEFPKNHVRPRAQPGARLGRRGDPRRVHAHHRGRHGEDHRQDPVGARRAGLLGRVVNSLGQPIDGKGPINAKMTDVIEKVAPGVIARQSVSQPVQTGLKAIDSMVPIGRGQRDHR